MPRLLQDAAILLLVGLMLATGLPTWVPGVPAAERFVQPFTVHTQLQQMNWQLFAPEPKSISTWVEAVIVYDDGSTATWRTPDWRSRTLFQRLVEARWPKYVDTLRRDSGAELWAPFCAWVVRQAAPRDAAPVEVRLVRHWWHVPEPHRFPAALARYGTLPPPRDAFPGVYAFHTCRLDR